MVGERGRRRNRSVVLLLLGAVAFLSVILFSLPLVEADSLPDNEGGRAGGEEDEEEHVCQWGDEDCSKDDNEEHVRQWRDEDNYEDDYDYKHGEEWDVWTVGSKKDLYEELECEAIFNAMSLEDIHTTETWKTFNKIYNEVIAATQGHETLQQDSTIPETFDKHGFQFPIEIKLVPAKGRGVYATTDIPKGSLLYLSTNNGAFLNGQTFRNFLTALPSKMACDVMIWCFARWLSEESEYTKEHMVCVDLDEGSFTNDGQDEDVNMSLGNDEGKLYGDSTPEEQFKLWHGCKMKFFCLPRHQGGRRNLSRLFRFCRKGWLPLYGIVVICITPYE